VIQFLCSITTIMVCLTTYQQHMLLLCLELDRYEHNCVLRATSVMHPSTAANVSIHAQAQSKHCRSCIAETRRHILQKGKPCVV
jgi:hypothetical protein